MRSRVAQLVKERVHWDLPKSRQLRFTIADTRRGKAVVRHAVVERVRPVRVRAGFICGYRSSRAGVVGEASLGEKLESVAREVEVRGAEARDGGKGDAGERVQRDEVPFDLIQRGCADVGHPEGYFIVKQVALVIESQTHVWSAISFPATYQSVTRV